MSGMTNLAVMPPGAKGRITGFAAVPGLARRLEEMGLRSGLGVVKISGMPLRGPVVVQIGGTRLAIGHGMAKKVMVETEQ